jgi:N4-gp56 family major capsid protein
MLKFLRGLYVSFLSTISSQSGTSPTSMQSMNVDSDADADYATPEIWEKRLRLDSARKSFWGNKKGKELSGQPIIEKEQLVNEPGDVIHIQTCTGIYGPGVEGESELRGNEDKFSVGQFNITVDWLRKAIAFTKKVKKVVNFDMVQQSRTLISDWLARELDSKVFTDLYADVTNTLYAGNATSEATLGDGDTLTTAELDKIKLTMDRIGAIPMSVKKKNGEEINNYGVVISELDEFNLRGDDRWLEAAKQALARSEDNPLFRGGPVEWNGLFVYTLRGVKAGGCVQGSPIRPECSLYANLTDAETTIYVGSAAITPAGQRRDFTKFFPTSGTIRIDNEDMTYTSKTYRTFVVSARGANSTTAATHTAGALITNRNMSKIIAFGAEIAAFGWGQHPERIEDKDDYGFITGIGIETLMGVQAIKDSQGNTPNYLVMKAWSKNPGAV